MADVGGRVKTLKLGIVAIFGWLPNVGGRGRTCFWRKRVGVEPTKDRLTAPPGFEVRTPHRGRFSSMVMHINHLAAISQGTKRHQ